MGVFLSTYENRIDTKGRISIPASYRNVLAGMQSPLFIYRSLTLPCLEGCGINRINQIVDALDQMDSLSSDVELLQTMLSSAQEMKIDSDGRILLSSDFTSFANLQDTALFAGAGRIFQLWYPEHYRKREATFRARAKEQALPRLTLTGRTP